MGWRERQYEKGGKKVRIRSGEKDWTREEKEQIRQYEEKYGRGNNERRKAS